MAICVPIVAPISGMTEEFSPEELRANLDDPLWRLSNLYKIIIKGDDDEEDDPGLVIQFKPNRAQRRFLARLHNRNIILKARQLGFCVSPETRVLTADLRWVPIANIEPGQEVVAVDENPPGGRGPARKMRTATVEAVKVFRAQRYRITFDDGREVVCTDRHPWLSRKAGTDAKWRSISGEGNAVAGRLCVGTMVRWVTKPWGESSVEDGWFGGMLDGEGCISKRNTSAGINVSQREGPVWDRLVRYARDRGYSACIEGDKAERPHKHGKAPVPKLAFGRMDEIFRLIGQTRPTRFIGNRFWEGRELPGKRNGGVGWATITKIEAIGEGDVVDMQTTTGTYIAEGFVSHNTTLICILWLDTALFSQDPIRCGIIAQDREAAENIFRTKVRFAYDNLPEPLKAVMPVSKSTASELEFGHNGSSIRVATSMRSGTIHRLHVSEFGKICAKYPDKAKEVVTGSIPAVPTSGILVIESTAEGQEGEFYKMSERAKALHQQKVALTAKDYRFHFFAWWDAPEYVLPAGSVPISEVHHKYFNELELVISRKITPEQRAWYVATLESDFSGYAPLMWQEYPSCIAGDVLVGTPEGIVPIKDAVIDGETILAHTNKGVRPVFLVRTRLGYTIRCTDDHPIKTPSGAFRKICEGLSVGDRVVIGKPMLSDKIRHVSWRPAPFVDGRIDISAEFAEFLGVFMGDGCFHNGTMSVACDAQDEDTIKAVESMFSRFFGGSSSRITGDKKGCVEVRKSSEWFADPLLALGIVERRLSGGLKRKVHVPPVIFRSPTPVVCAFLRGLFEADGFAARDGTSIKFFSKHGHVVRDVQLLLLAIGIESRASEQTKVSGCGNEYHGWELALRADGVRKFAVDVGFISSRKQARADMSLRKRKTGSAAAFDWTDEIVSIAQDGEAEVFDITTATHEFDAGGIVVHNCPEEAFQVSTEGCYYAEQLARVRKDGRIMRALPILPVQVNTFWDLGRGDMTTVWLHQRATMQDRFLYYYENSGEDLIHYVQHLQQVAAEKRIVWGTHYLPHEADYKRLGKTPDTNQSLKEMLEELWPGQRFAIVPRISTLQAGIEATRSSFSSAWFDEEGCAQGIKRLGNYRKKWNKAMGCWSDEEQSDDNAHGADAFRQWAQELRSGNTFASGAPSSSGFKRRGSPMAV